MAKETPICTIPKIKVSGVASISYWTIIFTKQAIYILNQGKNNGYGIYGAITDVYMSKKLGKKDIDLESVLADSKFYFRFSKNQKDSLTFKEKLFKSSLSFVDDDEDKKYVLSLTSSQSKAFKEAFENM